MVAAGGQSRREEIVMRFPLGKKGLLASVAIAGAVVYWRVRQSHRDQDLEWEEDLRSATDEGVAAARAALQGDGEAD